MKLIEVDSELVKNNAPTLFSKAIKKYEGKSFKTYAFVDNNNKIGFITDRFDRCILFNSQGNSVEFDIGCIFNTLSKLYKNDIIIMPPYKMDYYESILSCVDNGNDCFINVLPNPFEDSIYSGIVQYSQYNADKDILCNVSFDSMASTQEDKIFPSLFGNVNSIRIVNNYRKKGDNAHFGFIPSRIKFYARCDIEKDTLNCLSVCLKEFGIRKTLKEGVDNLIEDGSITRYTRINFKSFNNMELELPWPFCEYKKEKDIFDMVDNLGFRTSIPKEMIYAYNGEDEDINTLNELIPMIKENKDKGRILKI